MATHSSFRRIISSDPFTQMSLLRNEKASGSLKSISPSSYLFNPGATQTPTWLTKPESFICPHNLAIKAPKKEHVYPFLLSFSSPNVPPSWSFSQHALPSLLQDELSTRVHFLSYRWTILHLLHHLRLQAQMASLWSIVSLCWTFPTSAHLLAFDTRSDNAQCRTSYPLVCWRPENLRFLRSWRFCGLETSLRLPTDPHMGWSPGRWSVAQTQQGGNVCLFSISLRVWMPNHTLHLMSFSLPNPSQSPQLDIRVGKNTQEMIFLYIYTGSLVCCAYFYLSPCNLSLADSEIRAYTPMNRKQAGKNVSRLHTVNA